LQILLKICKLPQTLVDIFVNYDCDIVSSNIFERYGCRACSLACFLALVLIVVTTFRMVNELAGIAKNAVHDPNSSYDVWGGQSVVDTKETEIQLVALECLVTIMKSLVDWCKELKDEDNVEKDESETEEHVDVVDQLVQQKQYKQQLEEGKKLFNIKPRKVLYTMRAAKRHFV
jgi:brefeldin A-inhibited guanine nucleotide-exchange protein